MSEIFTDKQNVQMAQVEYKNYYVGNVVTIKDGTKIGYVSNVINDPSTGLQMYAVTDQPYEIAKNHPDHVNNVKVLFRGSTSPGHLFGNNNSLRNDAEKDWSQDSAMTWKIFKANNPDLVENPKKGFVTNPNGTGTPVYEFKRADNLSVTPQLKAGSSEFNKLLEEYPNADFYQYGQSMGEMVGTFSVVNAPVSEQKRIKESHFYEGPNIYPLLNRKQQRNADALKNRTFIYVDRKDLVPINYEKNQKHIGTLVDVKSRSAKVKQNLKDKALDIVLPKIGSTKKLITKVSNQHMWGGYQFDAQGNLKTKKNSTSSLGIKFKIISSEFNLYFGNDSGSGDEKVYLDAAEATETAITMKKIVDINIHKLINMEKERIRLAKSSWKNAYDAVSNQGVDLNHDEIIECLHVGGLNYGEVVEKTEAEAEEAIAKFKRYKSTFDNLVSELKSSINKMVSDDAELAGMFKDLGL